MQPELAAQREQALAVGAHEVRHRLALQSVPVKPNAAVQGEAHPLAAACELAVGGGYEQEILPSIVAAPRGEDDPEEPSHLPPAVSPAVGAAPAKAVASASRDGSPRRGRSVPHGRELGLS